MIRKKIPAEALTNLRHRLDMLPSRCQERRQLMSETASLYGVSIDTLYRALRNSSRPKSINRSDSGTPRKLSPAEMEMYCEVIAATKIRTCNKKGRHVSTARAIELLEDFGMNTPQGFIKPPKGLLTKATVNRYLKTWGYDHLTMTRQPPAVRFQATHSNECWHFDLSPSDLKHVKQPLWVEPGKDGRRVTARSKGKVERPFRTVKEAHETLYHFHEPENEVEANLWLRQYLLNYNDQKHRIEAHSRLEDWLRNLPKSGIRQMCSWERFCTFAREPQRRKVDATARVSVEGVAYEVNPDLAGETVVLWWGLFDNELYVEKGDQRYGPFYPVDGPIPLHRYRKHKKTKTEERADRIADLAKKLGLPRTALDKNADLQFLVDKYKEIEPAVTPFNDPDPFQEFTYPTVLFAKLAISDYLAKPLAKLSTEQIAFIDGLLAETLNKKVIIERVRQYFHSNKGGQQNAH
jgi:hypothetical protein